jgi:UDP-N-acetylmuramyl pentapeptide phosphotransferase/UDP-N-acetylglucosamine-1-phosphate transferase
MAAVEPALPEKSLSELVSDMTTDVSTLLRKEVELAKVELREEAQQYAKAGASMGAAGGVGFYAGFALVITLGLLLDAFLWSWLAFLIVTVALGAAAFVLFKGGQKKLKAIDPKPEATIQTLQEDARWLSERRS